MKKNMKDITGSNTTTQQFALSVFAKKTTTTTTITKKTILRNFTKFT